MKQTKGFKDHIHKSQFFQNQCEFLYIYRKKSVIVRESTWWWTGSKSKGYNEEEEENQTPQPTLMNRSSFSYQGCFPFLLLLKLSNQDEE